SVASVVFVRFDYEKETVDIRKSPTDGFTPIFDGSVIGLQPNSLATASNNNMGSPFSIGKLRSNHSKDQELEVIKWLSVYFGVSEEEGAGYVTSSTTEGNFTSIWWARKCLTDPTETVQRKILLLASTSSHFSIGKIADQLMLDYRK